MPMSNLTRPPETRVRRRTDQQEATAFVTEWALEQTSGTMSAAPDAPVVVVVGFDGSEPAERALDAAADLLRGREGQLEVIYVSQDPAQDPGDNALSEEPSTPAVLLESRLADEVRARLDTTEPSWHFQSRAGAVADELLDAAEELQRKRGPDATIVLVVGGSPNNQAQVTGSVSSDLALVDRFPLVVVP
jgi:nucleotide-binding universal stress UspA family protein